MIAAKSMFLMSLLAANPSVEFLEFTAQWCGSCQDMKPAISRLVNEGAPIRVVDFDENRQLAKRYSIKKLPTVLAIVDGKVVDRFVGQFDYEQLRNRMISAHQSYGGASEPRESTHSRQAVVRGQEPSGRPRRLLDQLPAYANSNHVAPVEVAQQASATQSQVSEPDLGSQFQSNEYSHPLSCPTSPPFETNQDLRSPDARRQPPSLINLMANGLPDVASDQERHAMEKALAATVRIRIKDDAGISLGSGTIIDVHSDEALVLTCGHIFQSSKGNGQIYCDLFIRGAQPNIRGKLISYNAKRDVGLISIRPNVKVTPVTIGGTGCSPKQRETAFSLGCNRGDNPSVIRDQVLDINRYLGPANIVVGGRPVQGRSGGGLFNVEGELIGVCNAADPSADEGLYAALGPIHAELDSAGLSFVYRSQSPDRLNQFTQHEPANNQSLPQGIQPEPPSRHGFDMAGRGNRPMANQLTKAAQGTVPEIICIVRPKGGGEGQAYVLDDPSETLMNELSRELSRRSPHQNTDMRAPRSPTATSPWQR